MKKELDKVYNPQEFEDKIYEKWEKEGYFTPEMDPEKEPYTIVIPPPNITGQLHMGHALDETLQDILIRFKRMQGYSALWIPGTDHASIATEAKIVEAMAKEGVTKEEIGREAFLERAWEWKQRYGGKILNQLKKLGSSCDWTKERFTLDEGCSKAVKHVFVKLYNKGLIYRGERMIHWCPSCKTSLSDAEVDYNEQEGHLWHLCYKLEDGSDGLYLATTRPETILGDTAVAVHPEDPRYAKFVGKKVIVPLVNRPVPVVADNYVDREFGTGVVKITPAHDPNDFEVGLRHDLPTIQLFTEDGHMLESTGKYAGLDRYEARKAILADLKEAGALVKEEAMTHNVGHCYRCGDTVEPRLSKQWFVKMKDLAEPAIKAVRNGETEFVPQRFSKIYFHWMENIRDWCISRQLWWGHRIPAYYCKDCGEIIVSETEPNRCSHCGSGNFVQDPDTLDTWFSSALWPFSTLGWPEETEELSYFYPTSTLVTGYDIIFFWVSRMIFSALEHTGVVPFKTVFIHGLVRDEQGRKMSKSLGNGIDPLQIVEKYGADALRFTLASGVSSGNDMRFSEEKVTASRNFANKLWNASRFVLLNRPEELENSLPTKLQIEDKWVLTLLNQLVKEVTANIEQFEISVATQKIYDFIWNVFCDWYIELCKPRLNGEDSANASRVLTFVLSTSLQLLHPFMPFITEEIWHAVMPGEKSIMISSWPLYHEQLNFGKEKEDFEKIIEAIKAVRSVRAEMNVIPSRKTAMRIYTKNEKLFKDSEAFFQKLAGAESLEVLNLPNSEIPSESHLVQVATDSARIFIPLEDLIDLEKEKARLNKEKENCEKELMRLKGKLSNQGFLSKAPEAVVQAEREKEEKAKQRLEKILESLRSFE